MTYCCLTGPRVNPLVSNGLSHRYHLEESILIFRGIRSIFFLFLFHFSIKFMLPNRTAPNGTPRLIWGYFVCLCPTKKDAGLKWLIVEWRSIHVTQADITNLINSMLRRCTTLNRENGGHHEHYKIHLSCASDPLKSRLKFVEDLK